MEVNILEFHGSNILSLLYNLNLKADRLVIVGLSFLINSDWSRVGQSLTVLGKNIINIFCTINYKTVPSV